MQIDYLAHHDYFVTELARWHFAQWSHLWSGDTVEARTKRLRQRCGSGGLPSVFVAFDGPALFGSATLVQYDFSDRPNLEAWLINLYVTPSMRRQGIGAALVSAVTNEARRSKVSRLCLHTASAEQYYERLGWTVLHRLHGRGELQTVMTLDLVPSK